MTIKLQYNLRKKGSMSRRRECYVVDPTSPDRISWKMIDLSHDPETNILPFNGENFRTEMFAL